MRQRASQRASESERECLSARARESIETNTRRQHARSTAILFRADGVARCEDFLFYAPLVSKRSPTQQQQTTKSECSRGGQDSGHMHVNGQACSRAAVTLPQLVRPTRALQTIASGLFTLQKLWHTFSVRLCE